MPKLLALALMITACAASSASAQDASPVGLWKTVYDGSGKIKALIRISEDGSELKGKIEKVFRDPGKVQNPNCDKCEGALKDQPKLGMTILSGVRQDGADYGGGTVLDPENGKVYKVKLSLADGGKVLNVRGYIGTPMLGRTQTWLREE